MSNAAREREVWLISTYDGDLGRALRGASLSLERLRNIRVVVEGWHRQREHLTTAVRNEREVAKDLRVHLKDRDAHIRNLEAQLRPHLVQQEPETEALL